MKGLHVMLSNHFYSAMQTQLALSSKVAKKTWTMFQSVKAAAFLDVTCH